MEILKRLKDLFVGRTIKCNHCDTKQRITDKDKYREEYDRDGHARVYKCGHCNGEIWIAI